LTGRTSLSGMVLWLLSLLVSPAPTTSHVVLGLAVVAAVLLIALAAARLAQPTAGPTLAHPAHRFGDDHLPRLLDPDAPGRPRPRAPAAL
jgi:hypothetical protein